MVQRANQFCFAGSRPCSHYFQWGQDRVLSVVSGLSVGHSSVPTLVLISCITTTSNNSWKSGSELELAHLLKITLYLGMFLVLASMLIVNNRIGPMPNRTPGVVLDTSSQSDCELLVITLSAQ